MKNSLLILAFAAILFQCSKKETTEQQANTADTSATISQADYKKKRFEEYKPDFQQLVVNYDGLVRGIDIGYSADSVKLLEKGKLVSETPEKLAYSASLETGETAEIIYLLTAGKVDAIEFNIKQSSADQVSLFILEFTDFFTNKYGPVIPVENDLEVWITPTEHQINVLDISKKDYYGIQVLVRK